MSPRAVPLGEESGNLGLLPRGDDTALLLTFDEPPGVLPSDAMGNLSISRATRSARLRTGGAGAPFSSSQCPMSITWVMSILYRAHSHKVTSPNDGEAVA